MGRKDKWLKNILARLLHQSKDQKKGQRCLTDNYTICCQNAILFFLSFFLRFFNSLFFLFFSSFLVLPINIFTSCTGLSAYFFLHLILETHTLYSGDLCLFLYLFPSFFFLPNFACTFLFTFLFFDKRNILVMVVL